MGAVVAAISASVAPRTDIVNAAPKAALVAGFQGTFQLAALIIVGATVATAIGTRKS